MDESTTRLISTALAEDIGTGDVTSEYFIPADRRVRALVVAREDGCIAGVHVAEELFMRVDPELEVRILIEDGASVSAGAHVMFIEGSARSVLTAERTALNFLQRLSGIASQTRQYVERVQGSRAKILDTRKTTPGWRILEKAAVVAGGGTNHRIGLYDRAMVKDNHLVAEHDAASLQTSIHRLKADRPEIEVELEADQLSQFETFLALDGVDYVLLDNMSLEELTQAVEMRGDSSRPMLEASGGVTLETVADIAKTGIDFISVGALTHSVKALDLAMDFIDPDEP